MLDLFSYRRNELHRFSSFSKQVALNIKGVAVEGRVVIAVCVLVLIWLVASYLRAQQALQWWHRRQSLRLCQEADVIRNGLLQESLSLRRQLELSLVQPSGYTERTQQTLLTTIEAFHTALNELSDYLAPPYLDDSLPLAIQFAMEAWKAHHPQYPLRLELPMEWAQESTEQGRILLITLAELLRLVLLEQPIDTSIAVSLTTHAQRHTLKLQVSCPAGSKLGTQTQIAELEQVSRAFCFLMPGQCSHQRQDQTLIWHLRWQPTLP